jgi:magnesium-transporting ATPase (P-type)
MLLAAAILSMIVGETTDGAIILGIVVASVLLDFWQEWSAANAVRELLALIRPTSTVLRDGRPTEVPVEDVVPGDVVQLAAGATVPGDCRILESVDLFVDEAALTGESFPVEKAPGTATAEAPIAERGNTLFMGTHVVSGTAIAVVARTGLETEFGRIAERLERRAPETDFERGVRHFGYTLLEITLVLVVFIGNMFSMAGASLITPFLPLLPQQILLINVLTDLPALAIATDRLDPEMLREPRRWDIRVIRRFMLIFGPVSSAFDYLTFGALFWLGASMTSFRTGWYLE